MAVILWDKKYTETLAETLKRFRFEKPEFNNEKVTYAGRLDPMAEGLVVLLTGNDVHKKNNFSGLDKVYEIDFICGPSTDSYDVLGLLNDSSNNLEELNIIDVKNILKKYIKKYKQEYPAYSSRTVQGKPLFLWAREKKLHTIKIPFNEVEVYSIQYLSVRSEKIEYFRNTLIENIKSVKGDFRQKEIIQLWNLYFKKQKTKHIFIYTIQVSASSGTYMRSLVENIGKSLGTRACSLKIKRISIDRYCRYKSV